MTQKKWIEQSKTVKKARSKYCKIHKIHFFDKCPMCPMDEQTQIDENRYRVQIKTQHAHRLNEVE